MSRSIPLVALIACVVAMVVGTAPAAPVPKPKVPADEQERLLARCNKFLKEGKVDMFLVANSCLKIKTDDLRQWQPAAEFAKLLIERTGLKRDDCPLNTPANHNYKDFTTYLARCRPDFVRKDIAYSRPDPDPENNLQRFSTTEVIQSFGVVDPKSIINCLILSRGDVQALKYGIANSVIFADGNVTARTAIISCVIVCDGDVTTIKEDSRISQCVVIARGNISTDVGSAPVLMATGTITFRKKPVKPGPLIVEGKPNTLDVTFFELETVGLEVKVADKAVSVSKVAAKSECEKAGLKAGDVILEAAGKKPTDAESLRRLLRDALAIGDASVKLQRGDKTEIVILTLPE